MFLLSFLKKKKINKTPPDISDDSLAIDVLETELIKTNTKPRYSVTTRALSLSPSRQQPTNITLLQGSSGSRPENHNKSENQRLKQTTSIRRESLASVQPAITNMFHVRDGAPLRSKTLSTDTTLTLYPSLESVRVPKHASSVKTKLIKVKEPKSIHDVAGEICFMIQGRILNADEIKKKSNNLQSDAQEVVLKMKIKIANPAKLEYTFNRELKIRQNYPHIKDYKKLRTFDDFKKWRHVSIERKMPNDKMATSIFKSYHSRFRCYKGQKSDKVDCD